MLITMLETRRGCEDGRTVRCFEKFLTYDVSESLARAFLAAGWAAYPRHVINKSHASLRRYAPGRSTRKFIVEQRRTPRVPSCLRKKE